MALNTVAEITRGSNVTRIDRYDRQRIISVEGDLEAGTTIGQALDNVAELDTVTRLPEGVSFPVSGEAEAFREPMAVAVICGLLASTLLSLVFVPVMYILMDDLKQWIGRRFSRLTDVTKEDRLRIEGGL
ncbi:MAG: hypothetical protein SPJ12_08100 [Duodenibacillus sp.]|nr:hypothetical protein [Duodenibacillus sp.]